MRARLAVALVAILIVPVLGPPVAAVEYEAVAESSACGYPRFYPPRTGTSGSLSSGHLVRGPAGALFGRSIAQIQGELVWWTVPMSDGVRVQVHRRLLPALDQVRANLEEAAASGLWYQVRDVVTSGYAARTSISHDGISYHGLGAAIDINADKNPYRLDGTLITDMPDWFVAAWEDAGMCWGGRWLSAKDPMHFSWSGPAATPGFTTLPTPYPPLTEIVPFMTTTDRHDVVFGPSAGHPRLAAEASGDGAPDVVQVKPWGDGTILEVATSRGGYLACSIRRWFIDAQPDGTPELADIGGVGRPDLVYVNESGPLVTIRRFHSNDAYAASPTITTGIPSGSGGHVFGDADADGADDLWVVTEVPGGVAIEVWSAVSGFSAVIDSLTVDLPDGAEPWRLATTDWSVDGRADLMLTRSGAGSSIVHVVDLESAALSQTLAAPGLAPTDQLGFGDYDGDGRPDLQVLSSEGDLEIWLGNSPLAGVTASDWFVADDFECPPDTLPYHYDGLFADDDDSVFVADIEWLAARGVTRGCNPPFNDWFCPDAVVTRGQMAAFLGRALDLARGPGHFTDIEGSVFEADIGALAATGITRGCNPPAQDRFCPDDPVTRGQMAAFLVRALDLAPAPMGFADADGSVFEADIGALAAAGITRGCNPPTNSDIDPPTDPEFCPDDPVTRGQMAAFLHRAAPWLPDA